MSAFANRPVGSVVVPCPLAQASTPVAVHWIEIQLVGEDNLPIAEMEYRLILPSGDEVTGYLDQQGLARIDNIEQPGTCRVSFPELDRDAWELIGTSGG